MQPNEEKAPPAENDAVAQLLQREKLTSITDHTEKGFNVLHLAAKHEFKQEVIKFLLHLPDAPAWLNELSTDSSKISPLHEAALHNNLTFIKEALQTGKANVNIRNSRGATPLMTAASKAHIKIVQELISQSECDITATNTDGATALHYACKDVYNEAEGINPNTESAETVAHAVEVVKVLLQEGIPPNQLDSQGYSILHFLAQSTNRLPAILPLLINNPLLTCFNHKTNYGLTPLQTMLFGRKATAETLEIVLNSGKFDISLTPYDGQGNTLLHYVTLDNSYAKVTEMLIQQFRLHVDAANKEVFHFEKNPVTKSLDVIMYVKKATPIHLAVVRNSPEIVKVLVKHGADTTIPMHIFDEKNSKNIKCTPYEWVRDKGEKELADLFLYLQDPALHQEYSKSKKTAQQLVAESARVFHRLDLPHQDSMQEVTDTITISMENNIMRKWSLGLIPLIKLASSVGSSVINIVFVVLNMVQLLGKGRKPDEDYDLLTWMMNFTEFIFVIGSLLLLMFGFLVVLSLALLKIVNKSCIPLLNNLPLIGNHSQRVMIMSQLYYFTTLSMAKFYFNTALLSSILMLFLRSWQDTFEEFSTRKRYARAFPDNAKRNRRKNTSWISSHIIVNILLNIFCTILFGYIMFIGSVSILLKLRQMGDIVKIYIGNWSPEFYFSFVALLNQMSTKTVIIIPEYQERFKVVGGNTMHVQNIYYDTIVRRTATKPDSEAINNEFYPCFKTLHGKFSEKNFMCVYMMVLAPISTLRHIVDPLYKLLCYLTFTLYPEQHHLNAIARDIIKYNQLPSASKVRVIDTFFDRRAHRLAANKTSQEPQEAVVIQEVESPHKQDSATETVPPSDTQNLLQPLNGNDRGGGAKEEAGNTLLLTSESNLIP